MNKIIHKNTLALLAVMVMLMATLLTACGSSKAADTSTKEDTTTVEVTKGAEPAETTEAEEVAEVEPAVEEPTAEPTPEPVVYEGIDMESTLPGAEWIETFDGVIDEPKFVIFNDETNKKVIIENEQEAEISSTDTFAIYYPLNKKIVTDIFMNGGLFKNGSNTSNVYFYYDLSKKYKEGDEVEVSRKIEVDGEEVELKATLVIKND